MSEITRIITARITYIEKEGRSQEKRIQRFLEDAKLFFNADDVVIDNVQDIVQDEEEKQIPDDFEAQTMNRFEKIN